MQKSPEEYGVAGSGGKDIHRRRHLVLLAPEALPDVDLCLGLRRNHLGRCQILTSEVSWIVDHLQNVHSNPDACYSICALKKTAILLLGCQRTYTLSPSRGSQEPTRVLQKKIRPFVFLSFVRN
jgi:hypothetical protein